MKKTLFLLISLLGSAVFAFCSEDPSFMPMNPDIMGQGGAITASASGYDSFFTNPAGFSREPRDQGSFTIGATSWVYARHDKIAGILGGGGGTGYLERLEDEATSGGLGYGGLLSLGWVGKGLGLGAFFLTDTFLYGPDVASISGDLTTTLAFVGGLSVPFHLGDLTIHVGGDLRPMIRVHTLVSNQDAMKLFTSLADDERVLSSLNSADALHGTAMAVDLGAIAELGSFSFGLSIRDVGGTSFTYNVSPFGTVVDRLTSGLQFPAGDPVEETYTIPMEISAGVAFHPDLGATKYTIDPVIHADLKDFQGFLEDDGSIWTHLHVGAEARLFSFFTVMAGLDQGYLTAGMGLRVAFFNLDFAVFTRELGTDLHDTPSSGASLGAAFRF
jgi:hypothetical protein